MKKSFKKDEVTEADAVSTEMFDEGNLPATQATVSVSLGEVSGPVEKRDVQMPRMHLVQGVGPLSEQFEPGSLVLNKEHVIYSGGSDPLDITVLGLQKYYEDRVPYDADGPMPTRYDSLDAVHEAGKWADWRNDQAPPVKEVADILALFERPANLECPCFSWELGDKQVAVAQWTVRGTAYTRGAKKIISASAVELKGCGLLAGKWKLGTCREKVGSNFVFVPVLRLQGKKHDDDTVKEIRALFGC